jgi:hypothetical protein
LELAIKSSVHLFCIVFLWDSAWTAVESKGPKQTFFFPSLDCSVMIPILAYLLSTLLLQVTGDYLLQDASLFLKQMANSIYSKNNYSAIELGMIDGEWNGPVSFINGSGGMHNLTKHSSDRFIVIGNELMKLAIKDDAWTFAISLKQTLGDREVLWTGSPNCSIIQEVKEERRRFRWRKTENTRLRALRVERELRSLRSGGKLFKFERAEGEDSLYQWGMIAWDLKNDKFLCSDEGFFDLEELSSDKGIAWKARISHLREVEKTESARKLKESMRVTIVEDDAWEWEFEDKEMVMKRMKKEEEFARRRESREVSMRRWNKKFNEIDDRVKKRIVNVGEEDEELAIKRGIEESEMWARFHLFASRR